MSLQLVPVLSKTANAFILEHHRHNKPPAGSIIRVGAANSQGQLVAVGVAGRPVARHFDDGLTLEVTRVASDGTRNATSMLYAALTRAGFALGYRRIITYTQANESGSSLKAAGWRVLAERSPRAGWDSQARPRDNGTYQSTRRVLWEATA